MQSFGVDGRIYLHDLPLLDLQLRHVFLLFVIIPEGQAS